MMRQEVLHQIPKLDSQGRVVRLFLLGTTSKDFAKRGSHYGGSEGRPTSTKDCPKPMLGVQGNRC